MQKTNGLNGYIKVTQENKESFECVHFLYGYTQKFNFDIKYLKKRFLKNICCILDSGCEISFKNLDKYLIENYYS